MKRLAGPFRKLKRSWKGVAEALRRGKGLPLRAAGVHPTTHWQPGRTLKRVDHAQGIFHAQDNDPLFRLEYPLRAGWYMATVHVEFPGQLAYGNFYFDCGDGESEANTFLLPLRNGRAVKRLIWLPAAARLRFDPLERSGQFALKCLRLVRVSRHGARARMLRKLKAWHPRYATAQPGHEPADLAACWADYCTLFQRSAPPLVSYAEWMDQVERPGIEMMRRSENALHWQPRFSVVMPVYNTPAALLTACIDSVLGQTYPHWELCIADDASTQPHVRQILQQYADRDARIHIVWRQANGHIAHASNSALALATGDFVALLDHDDLLAAHALQAVVHALQSRPTAQLAYSDEDKLDSAGQRCDPFFKPGWSPDLLYSQNYFSHLGVYRRELVESVGGFRPGFEGSQDYDLVLRCVARVADPADILHIPQVLYHWRMVEGSTARGHDQKDYASDAGRRALQAHFDAHHPGVQVSITAPGIYRHRWPTPEPAPLVSLIVPTRDGHDILRTCIESILRLTTYPHYEILVVDNQSTCPETLAYLQSLGVRPGSAGRVRVLHYDHPFNYSAINNFAATHAQGRVIGLINNDVEVINPDWLGEMVSHAMRPDAGCVGAKLYYPDDTLQHGGVVLGIGGVANHVMRGLPRQSPGYFGRLWTICNASAVTAAALVVRKESFDAVGGLDAANLKVAFNDVDLCLKVMESGLRNIWTPFAELYHHESISRGADTSPEKRARFVAEVHTMQKRWGKLLGNDPYYNPNLTKLRSDYSLADGREFDARNPLSQAA